LHRISINRESGNDVTVLRLSSTASATFSDIDRSPLQRYAAQSSFSLGFWQPHVNGLRKTRRMQFGKRFTTTLGQPGWVQCVATSTTYIGCEQSENAEYKIVGDFNIEHVAWFIASLW